MRLFAALVPPERALEDLDEFLEVRREAAPFRWTQPDQVHVTLAFLAQVPERSLDELVERLGRAAGRRTPFETAIAGGGAFPDAGRARVLWAGLDLDEPSRIELGRLATGARAAATKSGIEVDGQRFRAHLTVARLPRPQEVTRWVRLLDAYRGPEWTADTLSLVQSHLGEGPRNRPRYEVVGEFPLGRRAPGPSAY
jgi:2'-5' RNA ligase